MGGGDLEGGLEAGLNRRRTVAAGTLPETRFPRGPYRPGRESHLLAGPGLDTLMGSPPKGNPVGKGSFPRGRLGAVTGQEDTGLGRQGRRGAGGWAQHCAERG